ncbi:serine/threonine-protein kinase [Streptomyces sp. NPDC058401]|uniref:serine/threonine-protein kinase n=1 Tax=Streptomyces sp. NPDC058401 TaxID=3346480 RepID=UPI00365EFC8B
MTTPHTLRDITECDGTDLLPRGHRVRGWTITDLIGAGGWSTVYAAQPADRYPDRTGRPPALLSAAPADIALKIMPTAGYAPRQTRRIVESACREVELGRRAGHARLIRLLDSFVLDAPDRPALDGAIVLVMERAAGSLRELLDAGVAEADRPGLIAGICEGLAHLHGAGWVHADLKPENVLLDGSRCVKLSDFGLATQVTGTHGYAPPMGTLDYLPPERWRAPLGDMGVKVRPSADIWALGIIIHEVFGSGASPFSGATPMARGAAVQEYGEGRAPLRMDQAVPPFWRELAADCLAPTHAARAPHTAASLLARITAEQSARKRSTGRLWGRARTAILTTAFCGIAGTTLWSDAARASSSALNGLEGAAAGTIRVFNAEKGCQERADRDPQCSLGMAIDPTGPYTADNVVPSRVWHGDVLEVDCQLPDGRAVIDEADLQSTRWFHVRLPSGSTPPTAWLPAVRTRDRPALQGCPHPAAGR